VKKLTEKDVTFEIHVEQDNIPVRRNAMDSGDPSFDRQVEDDILGRLDEGDIWAWAYVTVIARWKAPLVSSVRQKTFEGRASLSACSYEDEADFKRKSGYYDDMKKQALDDLNANIVELNDMLRSLK
jgi:hypothetical protein